MFSANKNMVISANASFIAKFEIKYGSKKGCAKSTPAFTVPRFIPRQFQQFTYAESCKVTTDLASILLEQRRAPAKTLQEKHSDLLQDDLQKSLKILYEKHEIGQGLTHMDGPTTGG